MQTPSAPKQDSSPPNGSLIQRPSYLQLVLQHPLRLLLAIYHTLALLLPTLLHRLLLPTACSPTSFKVEILRCYLAGFLVNFWDVVFKAPVEWPRWMGGRQRYSLLRLGPGGVPTVVVPPANPLLLSRTELKEQQRANPDSKGTVVLLWAHGGGYLFGEPLQYLATYERWVSKAKTQGWSLVIFSVDYSESAPFCTAGHRSSSIFLSSCWS